MQHSLSWSDARHKNICHILVMSLLVGGSILFIIVAILAAAVMKQPIARTYAQHCVGGNKSHRNINCLPKLIDHTQFVNEITKLAGKKTRVNVNIESTTTWQKILDSFKDNIFKQILLQVVTPTDKIRVVTQHLSTIDGHPKVSINHDKTPLELGVRVENINYKITGRFIIPFNPPESTDKDTVDEIMDQMMMDIPVSNEFKPEMSDEIEDLAYGPFHRELYCKFEITVTASSALAAAALLDYEWDYAMGLPFAPVMIKSTSDASIHVELPDVSEDSVSVKVATCEDVQPKKCNELSGLICNILCDTDVRNKLVDSIKRNFVISFNRRPRSERSRIYTYTRDEINKIITSKFNRAKLLFTAGWAGIIGILITGVIVLFV